MKERMNWMFPQQKAIVSPESMMETPNTQQLSQKQSLASLSAATINLMRCCLDRMTTSEMRKPTMKVMPDISVSGEYLLIQDLCISVVSKGSRLPKQRQRKPTPNTNISSRHRGMQRYAAIQGIRQVVTTMMMQIAVATPSPISMSGMTCQVDKQGISCPLTLSNFSISSVLRCGARLAARASDTTAANSSRQRTQQNQSVHFRQRIGPSLHCTCSWISLSSSSIIKIQIILSELSCQQQKLPLYPEQKIVQLDSLFNVLLLQCLMLLFIKYPLFVDPLYIFLIAMLKLQRLTHCFSSALSVPIVDVKAFLTESGNYTQDCKTVAKALETYGCLIIKDPRVNAEQNNKFLDLMERFFDKRSQQFYAGRPVPDIFPEYDFQVGATPEYAEKARQHHEIITKYSKENTAQTPQPPPFDAKWRYFYNIGDVMEDIAQNRVPSDFPEFKETVEAWGKHMLDGCNTVAEMAAVGLGLERNIFSEMMKRGPHKLAPTGSDLNRYKVGTVFAGFHYDFNFLTIHGKARYPGLFAWLRTGEKFSVAVPEGHLLLQAGKQFEWVTGGHINCGYHEVIYTPEVQAKKNEAIKNGRIPWRISSTLFSHIRGDVTLQPLGKFATAESAKKYPAILAKKHAEEQLQAISLKRS